MSLLGWSVASILLAIALWIVEYTLLAPGQARAVLGGIAAQCFVWGAIDGLLAAGSMQGAGMQRRDDENLVKVLRFSSRLNWFWLGLAGLLLAGAAIFRNPAFLGHGIGVAIQAGFLFFFDRLFLRAMTRNVP
jgi:hypothetical protein